MDLPYDRNDAAGRSLGMGAEDRTDEYLQLLADERRRRVLYRLDDGETASLDELARQLADASVDGQSETDLKTSLYHVHLPQLSSGGLVEFSHENERVEKTEWPALVDSVLHHTRRRR